MNIVTNSACKREVRIEALIKAFFKNIISFATGDGSSLHFTLTRLENSSKALQHLMQNMQSVNAF